MCTWAPFLPFWRLVGLPMSGSVVQMGLMGSGVECPMSEVAWELEGRDRFRLRLRQQMKMQKTSRRMRKMMARSTPEMMPIFWVRALSTGKTIFLILSLSVAAFS